MYYYIFDSAPGAKEFERVAKIKEYISTLGIAGEMVTPTPGRSVEDLIELAIAKRYSTVVAVGGSELINRVARALEPYDTVFGMIPLRENPDFTRLIGASDWKTAADQLKRRRWQSVRLGLLNEKLCFLTPATIEVPSSCDYTIRSTDFTMQGSGGRITVTPWRENDLEGLELHITHEEPKQPSFFGFLKKTNTAVTESRFIVQELELTTEAPLPIVVAGSELGVTPAKYAVQEKQVKLIVGKTATPAQ